MNGFNYALLFFALAIAAVSCVRQSKTTKEGDALYLMYRTPFTRGNEADIWLSPEEILPQIPPSEKIFFENLSPDTLIFQINRDAYIYEISYRAGGREILINLGARLRGNAVSVRGHLIFIRQNEADRALIYLDNVPLLNTNLPLRK